MISKEKLTKWLSSKEAMKVAKIQSCDLMHYRVQGKILYEKRGNAYFYNKECIKKLKNKL